jgi:mannose-6-phosphate isomerase-like protein (cupin superfamily)
VGPGDTVYIPPGAGQQITNTGRSDLVFLAIVDPAWRAEDEELL